MSDTQPDTVDAPQPSLESREERPEKITKPKSPGRVAAGKKLAEMNRKNKAKKDKKEEPSEDWNIDPGYVIGAIGIILAAGSLYLQYKKETPKPAPRPVTPPPPKSRIPEME